MDLGSPPMAHVLEDHLADHHARRRWRRSCSRWRCSIDDYIITSFVAGPTITFPRRVFDSARIALPPQVHVLATMIMLTAIFIILAATIAGNRRDAKAG